VFLEGEASDAPASVPVAPPPAPPAQPVTVSVTGTGTGLVTSSPAGLTCGPYEVTYTGWFAEGATVTLTATPDAGQVFVGWTGACTGTAPCEVEVIGPQTVGALFGAPVEFYHLDVLGSVRMITNSAGAVVTRRDYLSFGEETGALTGDPRRFTGKELDPETALQYFGARYYRNTVGRFTSVDPVMDVALALIQPQRWNRYAYSLNSPLVYVDPNGKWPVSIHNDIIRASFPRLSPIERRAIIAGSSAVDLWLGSQLSANAYMHGMRAPWETREEARAKTDQFIADQTSRARNFANGNLTWTHALGAFGRMLHPILDRMSPAHSGEQIFADVFDLAGVRMPALFAALAYDHWATENVISRAEFLRGVEEARRQYLKVFGADRFFTATGCRVVENCRVSEDDMPWYLRK